MNFVQEQLKIHREKQIEEYKNYEKTSNLAKKTKK